MTLASRKHGILALSGCVLVLGLAGCQSVDDLAPQAGVRNTGTYPDLNVAPTPATTQLSGAEANQKVAALKAAQANAAGQGGRSTSTTPAQIKQASQDQRKTLKEIEGD